MFKKNNSSLIKLRKEMYQNVRKVQEDIMTFNKLSLINEHTLKCFNFKKSPKDLLMLNNTGYYMFIDKSPKTAYYLNKYNIMRRKIKCHKAIAAVDTIGPNALAPV